MTTNHRDDVLRHLLENRGPCCEMMYQCPSHHHSVQTNQQPATIFTTRCYASAVLAMALCLSVSPSVTSRSSTKTAKRRSTQTTPHDSAGTLVFWCQRSPRNSTGVTPYGDTKCRWGGSKSATFDK